MEAAKFVSPLVGGISLLKKKDKPAAPVAGAPSPYTGGVGAGAGMMGGDSTLRRRLGGAADLTGGYGT